MGLNIKDFNSWKRVNESQSFLTILSDLSSKVGDAFTGEDTPEVKAEEPKKAAETDAAKQKEEVKPITKDEIKDKPYTEKIQALSTKLGDSENIKTVDPNSKIFISLDLNKPENVDLYGRICQEWIDIRKPLAAKIDDPITGDDFAEAAEAVYRKSGVYVPPQLVLAQATLEGGFAKEKNKPINTKNIFNVGNTDDGSTRSFDSNGKPLAGDDPKRTWKGGIIAYFNILADRYLVPGKRTADDLVLGEFVNVHGNRYASGKAYEEGLLKLIDEINSKVIA
jgi:hypothetical protein